MLNFIDNHPVAAIILAVLLLYLIHVVNSDRQAKEIAQQFNQTFEQIDTMAQ